MAVPVTEKEALRKQYDVVAARCKESILLKEPMLEAKAQREAEKQVLEMFGVTDFAAKMEALEEKKAAVEAEIAALNRETIDKITGMQQSSSQHTSSYTYYSRNTVNPFEDYPDATLESLKSLVRARRRELLMETTTGRELNAIDESKTEFAGELTLCSNHTHMRELWTRFTDMLGQPRDGRQLSRISIESNDQVANANQ